MQRREILKQGAVGLAGLGSGWALVEHSTGQSHASLTMGELSISDASKTTRDGQIDDVQVSISGDWSYKLPSGKSPQTWSVTLFATNGESQAIIGEDSDSAKYLSNNGSHQISGSLTDTQLYSTEDFKAPDGKIKEVTIGFVLVFETVNPDGKVLAKSTLDETATVSVTNKAYNANKHGEASGSGGLTIIDE
jgi:hypothetical protein